MIFERFRSNSILHNFNLGCTLQFRFLIVILLVLKRKVLREIHTTSNTRKLRVYRIWHFVPQVFWKCPFILKIVNKNAYIIRLTEL